MGYTGGTSTNPSYRYLDDHSETVQIDYDPTQISYEELLNIFWASHSPTSPPWSRQYMSAIFYHNEAQRRLAEETLDREAARRGKEIYTEILPAEEFYLAEDYHQKYRLRNTPGLMREFAAIYPDEADFVNSTAAARVNGYLGGNGAIEALHTELASLGLSPQGQLQLLTKVDPAAAATCDLSEPSSSGCN